MKKLLLMLPFFLLPRILPAQQDLSSFDTQQQLEDLNRKTDSDNEDDAYLQRLQYFLKHPINLNTAGRDQLEELVLLDEIRITRLLEYRRILGKLISVYELQAIPDWNISLIRMILPYITLSDALSVKETLRQRLAKGDESMLLRWSRNLESAAGYKSGSDSIRHYSGSPDKLYLRYQFKYKNLLQFGILGEKDAGEQMFRGKQKSGFDFYSFHLFARKIGIIRELALGDFTVNMGQGLIHWQGLALGMGAGLLTLERQSPVLRPYSSPGESGFQRGAGLTIGRSHWELTGFYSNQKISAHLEGMAGGQWSITSILASGYHRTATELATKNNARLVTTGAVLAVHIKQLHVALNAVHYRFSLPLQKEADPYNLFAPRGREFTNLSFSYSYSFRNLHMFGEGAVDRSFHRALINGVVISLHSALDLSIVHRSLARDYQSIFGSAFTQNAVPSNEQGVYTGLTFRPADGFTLQAYADVYRFPWLKYRIDAPSAGSEYSAELTYAPSKSVELSSRIRCEIKPQNTLGADSIMSAVETIKRTNWRLHLSVALNKTVDFQSRCEMGWYEPGKKDQEQGYLLYSEVSWKPLNKPVSGNARLQYFETDGYNSRVYAYESNVLYGFSIPAFFDSGFRYYLNLRMNMGKYFQLKNKLTLNAWLRWAQSVYPGKKSLSDGNDAINGNRKSDITLQFILQ